MPFRFFLAIVYATLATAASADIYKCVDEEGHTTYMNEKPGAKLKNCVVMSREQPVTSVPMQRKSTSSSATAAPPAGFPRVSEAAQRSRDNDRRKILEQELETEMRSLESAKKELAEQQAVRLGDEKNYQKYLDRVQTYKNKVTLHERNAEAIRKEIATLK